MPDVLNEIDSQGASIMITSEPLRHSSEAKTPLMNWRKAPERAIIDKEDAIREQKAIIDEGGD